VKIEIPDGVEFGDLKLAYSGDGVTFEWGPVALICEKNGLSIDIFRHGPEDNICGLLSAWYSAHRESGGACDSAAEALLVEVFAEDASEQKFTIMRGAHD